MRHRLDITGRLQRRLLEIVAVALPLIGGTMTDSDLDGLAFLRAEMVDAIVAYGRHIDALGERARREDDAAALAWAAIMALRLASVETAYDAFRQRWAHRAFAENWPEYRLSAIVMMKQVRDHVQAAEDPHGRRQLA